jgi:Outer membrane lipoprotein-sorting protein
MKTDLLFVMACILALTGPSYAEKAQPEPAKASESTLTVDQVVQNTNRVSYYQGRDGKAHVSMLIKDSQGRERNRKFTILRRDQEMPENDTTDKNTGEQKFYLYFRRPADVNKMVFLVWKHIDKGDDRWLYLPALDLVKRIAAGDERTSFVGSDFFYEDISGRNINDDVHELVDTTDNYYILKNTPKEKGSVEFSYFKMWIHKETFLPTITEYYDKQGEKYRIYEALKVEKIDGYHTVTQSRMKNLRTKGETVLTYQSVKYNIGLPENIFTERFLRNPPKKYLR